MSRRGRFVIGRRGGFHFHVADGWVTLDSPEVIGGQRNLRDEIARPQAWSDVAAATGNNAMANVQQGSLVSSVGFDDALVRAQVDDVLWAVRALGDVPQACRVLEVGCGPGILLSGLRQEFPEWQFVGVDPSPDSVDRARRDGHDVHLGTLETADVTGPFDLAVVMGNFQLHADPLATLHKLFELSSPGAVLYLDAKNPRSAARRLGRALVTAPGTRRLGISHSIAAHAFHGMRHGIPRQALLRLLESAGWEVLEVRTISPRLLRFGNQHGFAAGTQGLVWRLFDVVDGFTDERAWLQIAARRRDDA